MGVFSEKKAIRTLEEDLSQLRRRLDEVESAAKIGKLEAAEVYDKTLRLMQRMAKRYEVDQKEALQDLPANSSDSPSVGLDPISRSIMLRRARQFQTQ